MRRTRTSSPASTCCSTCAWAEVPGGRAAKVVFYHRQDAADLRREGGCYLAWSGDGEFICEEDTRVVKAIGGGNFLILARDQDSALAASERAIAAMQKVRGVIMPFPGGVVRSGSKVGSKYKTLPASTNHLFCPTLKGAVQSELDAEVGAVLEIVIDGLDAECISTATRVGIEAACKGRGHGVLRISAGNYGGTLGPVHLRLHHVLQSPV